MASANGSGCANATKATGTTKATKVNMIGNKKMSLNIIKNYDFDLLRKRFNEETDERLKEYAKQQLSWIDDALCYRELVKSICDELFPNELDKIIIETNGKLFLEEDDNIYINRLTNAVYNAIALVEKSCIVDVINKYKFVKDLVLKLYCLYQRDYEEKYIVDEEMEYDEEDYDEEDEE
jgi:hypothetical protein